MNWTPVTERLPEVDLVVLAALKDMDEPVWLAWYDGEHWLAVEGAPCDVTHWMEMPATPETAR